MKVTAQFLRLSLNINSSKTKNQVKNYTNCSTIFWNKIVYSLLKPGGKNYSELRSFGSASTFKLLIYLQTEQIEA